MSAPTTPPAGEVGKTSPPGALILTATTDSSPGASLRPAPGEDTTPTDAHWRAAADAVTTHRGEAIQVAAVARAIAQAEQAAHERVLFAVESYAAIFADENLTAFLNGVRRGLAALETVR